VATGLGLPLPGTVELSLAHAVASTTSTTIATLHRANLIVGSSSLGLRPVRHTPGLPGRTVGGGR